MLAKHWASTAVRVGQILVLVGGIITLIFALIGWIGVSVSFVRMPGMGGIGAGFLGLIIGLICGLIAIFGSKRAGDLVWSIILIIVGIVAGGIGGILVVIGAIIALVGRQI